MTTQPETTMLPVIGPPARVGVMGYFAVLAYPEQEDWPKRDELVNAFKACLLKSYIRRGGDWRRVSQVFERKDQRDYSPGRVPHSGLEASSGSDGSLENDSWPSIRPNHKRHDIHGLEAQCPQGS